MNVKDALRSQYLASLAMIEEAVRVCPDPIWNDPSPKNRFWHIAYHALHYVNLYLAETLEAFTPWKKHRDQYQYLGRLPWPPHEEARIGEPYEKEAILDYVGFCRERVAVELPGVDLEAPSGFPWLPFDKLELQVYNIRHAQHHAGQLADRLRAAGLGLHWVGMGPEREPEEE